MDHGEEVVAWKTSTRSYCLFNCDKVQFEGYFRICIYIKTILEVLKS